MSTDDRKLHELDRTAEQRRRFGHLHEGEMVELEESVPAGGSDGQATVTCPVCGTDEQVHY